MKLPRLRFHIAAAILILLPWGCAAIRPAAPEVNLLDLRIEELTLSHANLLADLRIYNPNVVAITIKEIQYNFFLDGVKLASGQALKPVQIESDSTGEMTLRVSTGYLSLLDFTAKRRSGQDIEYQLEGSLRAGGLRILDQTFPFKRSGVLSLERLPLR